MIEDTWIADERKHERDMAEIKARDNERKRYYWHERIGWIIIAMSLVSVIGIVAALIWWAVGNSTRANTERDIACNESGGTRVTITNGPVLCIHMSEVPR